MLPESTAGSNVSFFIFSTFIFASVALGAVQYSSDLSVNVPLLHQVVGVEDVARYTLQRMHPHTAYEVRVSYPASVRPGGLLYSSSLVPPLSQSTQQHNLAMVYEYET